MLTLLPMLVPSPLILTLILVFMWKTPFPCSLISCSSKLSLKLNWTPSAWPAPWKVLINIHLCKLARFSLPLLLFDARPNFLFAAWLASHSCAKRLEAKWSLISMRSCFQSIQRGCFRVKSSFECWSVLFAVCFRFFKLSSNFQLKLDRKIVNGKIICVLTTLPVHAG